MARSTCNFGCLWCGELAIWGCECTPCSFCRSRGIDALIESRQAPRWLLEDALHDCDSETREAAAEALNQTRA